jgi:DNA-directed RNA polymerase subunit RPC12/RpoP
MNDSRQQHGHHTWDLILHYYRCPHCGYIRENRDKFKLQNHLLQKDLICLRCQHTFVVTKKRKQTFGPLWGHDPEIAN